MALINCPECGKQISDNAKACPECGFQIQKDLMTKKLASQTEKIINENKEKINNNKKSVTIIGVIACIVLMLLVSIVISGNALNENEKYGYECALELKNMMKNPDSFEIFDEIFILKHKYKDEISTYLVLEYGGTNGYGAFVTDYAIFEEGKYIVNLNEDVSKSDSDYLDKRAAQMMIDSGLMDIQFGTGDEGEWELININPQKIKNKLGL